MAKRKKPLEHPLDAGTQVKVANRQRIWTISRPIEQEGELVGYWVNSPSPKFVPHAIRLEDIKPK